MACDRLSSVLPRLLGSKCCLTTELSGRPRCRCRGQTRPTMPHSPLQRVVSQRHYCSCCNAYNNPVNSSGKYWNMASSIGEPALIHSTPMVRYSSSEIPSYASYGYRSLMKLRL